MIRFLLCCFLTGGFSLEVQIHQTPSALIRKVGEDVQLVCSHGHIDYRVMLWYQWLAGDLALKLIGYGYSEFRNDSVEETFRKSRFSLAGDLSGNKNRSGSLFIKNLSPQEHTATYFCAARKAQYTKHPPAPHKNHLPADWLLGCVLSSEFDLNTADFGVQAPLTHVYASFSGAGATNSSPRGLPSYTSEPFPSSNTPDLNNK
ncbi:putative LOC107392027-like protein [Nothobranchius furzeri]|uniref:LOC107391929-like protein n=2 Tax=Nothobranchius furzeri TaxID=105023 RepID=A0A9D3BAJ1_NOTFU|nr:putative LOC107391929-like protein [Nothobranchius furzeri]KAF7201430.1 putative LOC107392027-like protein [Nothobranchius furzeri]